MLSGEKEVLSLFQCTILAVVRTSYVTAADPSAPLSCLVIVKIFLYDLLLNLPLPSIPKVSLTVTVTSAVALFAVKSLTTRVFPSKLVAPVSVVQSVNSHLYSRYLVTSPVIGSVYVSGIIAPFRYKSAVHVTVSSPILVSFIYGRESLSLSKSTTGVLNGE
jgi:hypothetical protein